MQLLRRFVCNLLLCKGCNCVYFYVCIVHLVYSFYFNHQCTIYTVYIFYFNNIYYNHPYTFRYTCVILREFHSCTLLKLHSFCIIKISLNNNQIKLFMWLLFIKCTHRLYDFYNKICISSMFMWPYTHLDIPVLMVPQHTGNINTEYPNVFTAT